MKAGQQFVVANCGQLLTLAGAASARCGATMRNLGILKNAAMLVRDGRIGLVGTWKEVRGAAGALTEEVDAGGRLVTPGFVDAHTHLVFGGNRVEEFERRGGRGSDPTLGRVGGGIPSSGRPDQGGPGGWV